MIDKYCFPYGTKALYVTFLTSRVVYRSNPRNLQVISSYRTKRFTGRKVKEACEGKGKASLEPWFAATAYIWVSCSSSCFATYTGTPCTRNLAHYVSVSRHNCCKGSPSPSAMTTQCPPTSPPLSNFVSSHAVRASRD